MSHFWRQPLDRNRVRIPLGIVRLIPERCKGCGFCIEFCPRHLLSLSRQTNSKGYHYPETADDHDKRSDCIYCGLCALLCPDFAIYVEDGGQRAPDHV
jgi:2-oxoglutarate ferredoxin oxidoreductase subunit delta